MKAPPAEIVSHSSSVSHSVGTPVAGSRSGSRLLICTRAFSSMRSKRRLRVSSRLMGKPSEVPHRERASSA
jgi:hypothetical protein